MHALLIPHHFRSSPPFHCSDVYLQMLLKYFVIHVGMLCTLINNTVFLLDYNGCRLNLTVVQYIVTLEEDDIEIKPHGNASSLEPYFRTSTSTLQGIKSKLQSSSPKEAIETVSKEWGGEMLAKSTGPVIGSKLIT